MLKANTQIAEPKRDGPGCTDARDVTTTDKIQVLKFESECTLTRRLERSFTYLNLMDVVVEHFEIHSLALQMLQIRNVCELTGDPAGTLDEAVDRVSPRSVS